MEFNILLQLYGYHATGDLSNASICLIDAIDAERLSSQYDAELNEAFFSTFLIPCAMLFCLLMWLQYLKQNERKSDFNIALLYLRFHVCDEIYRNNARTKLLQDFIGRTFDKFIDVVFSKSDIHKTPLVRIKELNAELKTMRHSRFTNNNHDANLFQYTDRIRLERGKLAFRIAATFMSNNSENTAMDPTQPDFESLDINYLNVPALLDIINNCRLFNYVRKQCNTIVDCYVNNVTMGEESDECMNAAIGAFLNQIDDRMLPDKSLYQNRLNGIVADSSTQNTELQQRTNTVERGGLNTLDAFNPIDSYDDYGRTLHQQGEAVDDSSNAQQATVVERWNLFREGDDPNVVTNLDDDKDTKQELRLSLLYLQFHVCKKAYKNDKLSNLLQELLSKFVERRFNTLIDNAGLLEMTREEIRKFDDVLKNLRHSNFSPNDHWSSWFEYTDCNILGRRQLLFCTAVTFMSASSEDTEMDPANTDFKTMDIKHLSVPALLDIIYNCTLFGSSHEYVKEIVAAYVNDDFTKKERAINVLLDQIDVNSLPDKVDFQNKVKACVLDTGIMKSLQNDLDNPLYINWVKGTLTLKYLSEGVRGYILEIFRKFTVDLPDAGSHFDDGERLDEMRKEVNRTGRKWQYIRSHCPECKSLFDKVLKYHRRFNRIGNPGKSHVNDIPDGGAWGIAKMYMPGYCRSSIKPEEADAQSLLQLIRNCDLFPQQIAHIQLIIDMRHKLMHSPALTFQDSDLKTLSESEVVFLEQAIKSKELQNVTVASKLDDAKQKIDKLIDNEMKIVVKQANDALQYQHEELTRQVNGDNSLAHKEQVALLKIAQLELKIKEQENMELHEKYIKLKQDFEEQKKEYKTLKREFDKLEYIEYMSRWPLNK